MDQVDLLSANELDFPRFARLQKLAFAAHLSQYSVDAEYMNEGYFRWKYLYGFGVARIAIAIHGADYVASVVAIPLQVGNLEWQTTIWRLVDIATDPSARGRGLYMKTLRRFVDSLGSNELLAGFPNKNSTRGFRNAGSEDACYVPTWVAPILPVNRSHSTVREIQSFEECGGARWAALFVPRRAITPVRSSHYFAWRYRQHPEYEYRVYVCEYADERGLMVLRIADTYGRRMAYVLELWASNGVVRSRLLETASVVGREHGCRWKVMVTNCINGVQGLKHLFLPVPRRLLPKQQILRGICADEGARTVLHSTWRIQMGDILEF